MSRVGSFGQEPWLRIYTPAYGLQVSCHHAMTISGLVATGIASWGFGHDSLLPVARGRALARAMGDKDPEICLMIDADCWIPIDKIPDLVDRLNELRSGPDADGIAMLGLICRQRDGRPNAWHRAGDDQGPRLTAYEAAGRAPVRLGAIGFGAVAMRLAWYRAAMARGLSPDLWFGVIPSEHRLDDGAPAWTGEDVFHCAAVRKHGGEIIGLGGVAEHGTPQAWGPAWSGDDAGAVPA